MADPGTLDDGDQLLGTLDDGEGLEAELADFQAVAGPPGPPGPPGPAGAGGGGYYVHEQGVPASTWTVVHGLSRFPAITVIDSAGEEVDGEFVHLSTSVAELRFTAAFSGRAVCN